MKPREKSRVNPLLAPFDAPRQATPFDKILMKDHEPAIKTAIEEARATIERVAGERDTPSFENTIRAIELATGQLDRLASILFNLLSANTSKSLQACARRVSPLLAAFRQEVFANQALFARVKWLHDNPPALDEDGQALLQQTWRAFIKRGAALDAPARERFKEISVELSRLSLDFDRKVLADTNEFRLHVTDEEALAGIPEGAREAAADAAAREGSRGWVFTLHAPSYVPFMQYAGDRQARERMYRAHASRGFRANGNNTEGIVKRTAALRLELARLMGYPTYAAYALADRMASDPGTVERFLADLREPYHEAARREAREVFERAARDGVAEPRPWDWAYYANKVRQERHGIDDELLRPYFPLERVEASIFDLARGLYGITFRPAPALPRYHEEVRVFEVFDEGGKYLALLYLDYFPRENKEAGAWMTTYREQAGEERPHVSLVMNFTRPTATRPSLLTLDEVITFLHEFGHGLHGMLSRCAYASISGTNVYRDFVELPSQIMENWLLEKEWLDTWAVHHETGDPLPAALLERVHRARLSTRGYAGNRQVSFGLLDMAWHSITAPVSEPIADFETRAMAPTALFAPVDGTALSTAFSHLFSGGYAAGYYGYKWAEVLDADAFALFKQRGIFDRATAAAFRAHVLEQGARHHPMTLYQRFRGAAPTTAALLEREGLPEGK
jgi:peptidyl-dipeptidase Dcp